MPMEATGMVRKVDSLGRIALPAQLRKKLDIKSRDEMEIFVDGDHIILQGYKPACIFCGGLVGISDFKGKLVCRKCLKSIGVLS